MTPAMTEIAEAGCLIWWASGRWERFDDGGAVAEDRQATLA